MKQTFSSPLMITVVTFAILVFGTVYGRVVFQITPTLTISEEYTDNFFSTKDNKEEEFITAYALGFSAGILDANKQVYLSYSPTYQDYRNLDDRDRITHILSMDAAYRPTKHTELAAQAYYEGNSDNNSGENRENKAVFSGKTDISKQTSVSYGHTWSDRFEQQLRTGEYKAHTINTTEVGASRKFGKKDILDVTFIYETDNYDTSDADGYDKFEPEASLTYWFTPKDGMTLSLGYENKDSDDEEDSETISGYAQYNRNVSRTFDWFLKYRHAYSDTTDYTHHIFHPSLGFDWDVSEDSGVTAGVGVLFHQWSNDNDDDPDPFLELDAFKRFEFSRRTALTFTGESSYSSSSDDASSLGYNISYQAGAQLEHQLMKRLSASMFGSYQRIEFNETDQNRTDDTASLGAGLNWNPLRWLQFSLNYSYTDYQTSSSDREDYEDNRFYFTMTLIPETPIRPDKTISRSEFNDQIFADGWNR
ncbi:MAG TPA: hypothetical protein DHV36_12855 [Desulfobacteraceae bacterium]|nr:hypothetical protein [Desulfobacteraceae bacterium]